MYEDKKYNFTHKSSTKGGSSGSPILNLNNKVIGIHKEGTKQYNKGTFLNYPIKEFIHKEYTQQNKKGTFLNYSKKESIESNKNNEELLKEFNNKYNLNIQDTNIKLLDLGQKKIGNEELNDLCKIEFKELKKLVLFGNNISDIKALENAKFDKLEGLYLNSNQISDINILEKVNFKGLKDLFLNVNKITDIKVLAKVNFNKLEILHLGHNKLSNVKILETVKFNNLKYLDLSKNQISERDKDSIMNKLKSRCKTINI